MAVLCYVIIATRQNIDVNCQDRYGGLVEQCYVKQIISKPVFAWPETKVWYICRHFALSEFIKVGRLFFLRTATKPCLVM